MIRLGIIGRGAWARNITNTLNAIGAVSWVTAPSPSDPLDAVIIANKSRDHVATALPFLRAGRPCFIEKPVAASLAEFTSLQQVVAETGSRVFVGHLHLFNPAVQVFLVQLPRIGAIRSAEALFGNAKPRSDVSVIWDWLPHPLYLAAKIFGAPPKALTAKSPDRQSPPFEVEAEVTYGDVSFDMRASWTAPESVMRIAVTGDHGQLVFDDKSVSKVKLLLGDQSLHPEYPDTPPLLVELQAFLGMVEGRIPNTSQLEDAAQVIQVLDAIERSCELGGERIQISS